MPGKGSTSSNKKMATARGRGTGVREVERGAVDPTPDVSMAKPARTGRHIT